MTPKINLTPRELELLVEARKRMLERTGGLLITPEQVCGNHVKQLAFVRSLLRWIVVMCSRRAGKTHGIATRFATRSMLVPGGNRVYLALTAKQAREIMWEAIWLPMCEKYRLPCRHNETRMITKFENGSKVRLGGTDDIAAIKTELGAGLDEAAVDECQDQPDRMLRPLLTRILPPALTDRRGVLLAAGVVPEVEAGFFMELWQTSNWDKHNFSQMDNPHMRDPMGELLEYLESNPGLTLDSPVVQRERFGKFVYDLKATAYTYSPELNGYDADPPGWLEAVNMRVGTVRASEPRPGIDRFTVGADPGGRDRTSVVVWGWGEGTQEVQHVFEWVTDRNTKTGLSDIAAAFQIVMERYSPEAFFWDPGSGSMEIDTFTQDYGVPLVRAATKTEKAGQVRRVNDLLTKGWLKVMKGSALEEDYRKSRWDPDKRAKGLWEWASQWHPDPADAARYALQGYYEAFQPADDRPPSADPEGDAIIERVMRDAGKTWIDKLEEDERPSPFAFLGDD